LDRLPPRVRIQISAHGFSPIKIGNSLEKSGGIQGFFDLPGTVSVTIKCVCLQGADSPVTQGKNKIIPAGPDWINEDIWKIL
jgi:hypothetical protein